VFSNGPRKGGAVVVGNMSRGGVALETDWSPLAGETVMLTIGATHAAIEGRVVRPRDGILAIAFAQDEKNLALIDEVLAMVERRTLRAA
jgi:hypothetical protein